MCSTIRETNYLTSTDVEKNPVAIAPGTDPSDEDPVAIPPGSDPATLNTTAAYAG